MTPVPRRPLIGTLETKHVDDAQYHAYLSCRYAPL